jgi:hypothetical protein
MSDGVTDIENDYYNNKETQEWMNAPLGKPKLDNKVSHETVTINKSADTNEDIFTKGKIEGLEEAKWLLTYALPHIDPNGKLEKQTKYLMESFEKKQDDLRLLHG